MQDHLSNLEQAPAPELVWAKRFSRSESLILAIYFFGIPLLISCTLIYWDVSPSGYVALLLSVLGVAWVSHRFGQRRYAITGETVCVDLAPIGSWKVKQQEVALLDVLFVSVKPRAEKIYAKAIVYHRGDGPPVVFDFLSKYEALTAAKTIEYYCEIKKFEPIEPIAEASPENPETNPDNETNQEIL
ncbi:MAG TPA: hypothetical protein VNW23_08885 [Opitutaceae bacterium]|jgi:hypothetical protein|nr:hypothetical protein [Opitutaceae bacterium]